VVCERFGDIRGIPLEAAHDVFGVVASLIQGDIVTLIRALRIHGFQLFAFIATRRLSNGLSPGTLPGATNRSKRCLVGVSRQLLGLAAFVPVGIADIQHETGHERVLLEQACELLDRVASIPDALDFHKSAQLATEASAHLRRTHRGTIDLQLKAAEVELLSARKLGELLAAMPKNKGAAAPRGDTESPGSLVDLGIHKKHSSRWQQLAAVPRDARSFGVSGSRFQP
jgi:hypothetical protein